MAGILLVAFASRALIPPGFMPASGRPFSMELCPEGLPAGMLAQLEPSSADSMEMDSMGMEPREMDSAGMDPKGMDSKGMDSMGIEDPVPADSGAADLIHDSMHRHSAADSMYHRGRPQEPHHHGSSSQSEHCVFATACSAGPIPHLGPPGDLSSAQQIRSVAFASIAVALRAVPLPQPRAPPSRLS